jgi:hypothetical protein
MPRVLVTSTRFPGAAFPGCPLFAVGVVYDITLEQAATIRSNYETFDPMIKADLKIEISGDEVVPILPAIAVPAVEPELAVPVEAVPDVVELSDDDLDLISIEISKLNGKTIKEAEPLIIQTGGNPELPRLLRVTYLEEVQKHPEVQKTLKEVAEKLLEQI